VRLNFITNASLQFSGFSVKLGDYKNKYICFATAVASVNQ
jgi:hypothetical protein